MKLKPYPKYKETGLDWLGLLPENWDVFPLKWHIIRNDGGVWGDEPDGLNDTVVLRSTEQSVDGNWKIEDPAFRKISENEKLSSTLEVGDLLVTKSSGSALHIGKTTLVTNEISELRCCYSNFMQRIRMKSFHPKLAWYLMNNVIVRNQFDILSNSTTGLANLSSTIISQVLIQSPPIVEQEAIVNFLDHETAKLDTLISKQEKLIELLQEKRQAIISHAVTKGLNPDAKMKDSGVEWLGEVPFHWSCWKISHAFGSYGSGTTPPSAEQEWYEDGKIPWLTTGELRENVIFETSKLVTQSACDKFSTLRLHPSGSLVIAMYGATIGRLGVLGVPATTNQACCVLSLPNQLNIKFTFFWFLAFKKTIIDLFASGGGQPNINQETILNLRVLAPDILEQDAIAIFLDSQTQKIDTLIDKAKRSIELAKEHRAALISAAVTGKIDVREAA